MMLILLTFVVVIFMIVLIYLIYNKVYHECKRSENHLLILREYLRISKNKKEGSVKSKQIT